MGGGITRSNSVPIPTARADKLHKARVEKAYWETIATKRAAGETIIEKYTEENFPGPRTGLEPPMEEEDGTDDEDKPLFEPFFMDYDNFACMSLPFIGFLLFFTKDALI